MRAAILLPKPWDCIFLPSKSVLISLLPYILSANAHPYPPFWIRGERYSTKVVEKHIESLWDGGRWGRFIVELGQRRKIRKSFVLFLKAPFRKIDFLDWKGPELARGEQRKMALRFHQLLFKQGMREPRPWCQFCTSTPLYLTFRTRHNQHPFLWHTSFS